LRGPIEKTQVWWSTSELSKLAQQKPSRNRPGVSPAFPSVPAQPASNILASAFSISAILAFHHQARSRYSALPPASIICGLPCPDTLLSEKLQTSTFFFPPFTSHHPTTPSSDLRHIGLVIAPATLSSEETLPRHPSLLGSRHRCFSISIPAKKNCNSSLEIDAPSTRSARRRTVSRTSTPVDDIHRQPVALGLPCYLLPTGPIHQIFLMRTGIK
jgi:hypothetical protein